MTIWNQQVKLTEDWKHIRVLNDRTLIHATFDFTAWGTSATWTRHRLQKKKATSGSWITEWSLYASKQQPEQLIYIFNDHDLIQLLMAEILDWDSFRNANVSYIKHPRWRISATETAWYFQSSKD